MDIYFCRGEGIGNLPHLKQFLISYQCKDFWGWWSCVRVRFTDTATVLKPFEANNMKRNIFLSVYFWVIFSPNRDYTALVLQTNKTNHIFTYVEPYI